MSYSAGYSSVLPMFSSLQYRDIGNGSSDDFEQAGGDQFSAPANKSRADVEMAEVELATRIREERAQAAAQQEQKLRQEYEQKLAQARMPIATALKEFSQHSDDYFARVEAEVVQLALSIAAKILHREAQVDPMLVATLVRMAVEKMREDSNVTVRVSTGRGAAWRQFFAGAALPVHLEVVEDAQLSDHDCIVETELGSANFGLDTQLKEVEQGFFDLLALRPTTR